MKFSLGRFAFAIFVYLCIVSASRADENVTLDNAVAWLVQQQDESGAIKSQHYGAMKQGAALTSLTLYSLSFTSENIREENQQAIDKAFAFLMPGTETRGRVANPDGSLDHTVYGTAMFLVAAKRFGRTLEPQLVRRLLKFLVDSQCVESRGFEPENPNYGGWDVIGPDVMPGKTAGTNVSVTRYVVEAFDAWHQDPALDEVTAGLLKDSKGKAKTWLQRLHAKSPDGGFIFTAQPGSALNKAKSENGDPMPYSTATCDGHLTLAMLETKGTDDKGLADSADWLVRNVDASAVSGFAEGDPSGWPEALHFYHLQALARVASREDFGSKTWAEKTRGKILQQLQDAQRENGSFKNDSALMREDDPVIATGFAIIALALAGQ